MTAQSIATGFLLFLLSATAVADPLMEPGALIDSDVRKKTKKIPELARTVRLYGYRCESISALKKLDRASGYVLVCDNFTSAYEIQRYGKNWIVTRSGAD